MDAAVKAIQIPGLSVANVFVKNKGLILGKDPNGISPRKELQVLPASGLAHKDGNPGRRQEALQSFLLPFHFLPDMYKY